MKNKILSVVVIILGLYTFKIGSKEEITSYFLDEKKTEPVTVTIKNLELGTYQNLSLEDYLIGVVAGEMPASFSMEALKAQAVASRTYALYKKNTSSGNYDLTTDSSTQVYLTDEQMKDKWQEDYTYYYNLVRQAVLSTANEVITYDGQIISAYYFAMSNGKTESAQVAFGENKSYLVSVDAYDENEKNYEVTNVFDKDNFCNQLNISCINGINISQIEKSPSGRVISLNVNGTNFSGTNLRHLLNLRSNDFTILIDDDVKITTIGFGHGVGMSQYGANNMAKMGYNYKEILNHFYTGTTISNLNSII